MLCLKTRTKEKDWPSFRTEGERDGNKSILAWVDNTAILLFLVVVG